MVTVATQPLFSRYNPWHGAIYGAEGIRHHHPRLPGNISHTLYPTPDRFTQVSGTMYHSVVSKTVWEILIYCALWDVCE